jgi:catechol 2,3-dioxygenase-like lactoylglutathione lyase family enzyme
MATMAPTQTKLGSVAPFFIVADIEPSIAFYVERLGFALSFKGPADDPYFAIVERDDAWFMLKAITPEVLPVPNPTRHGWARWDAFVSVEDPDALAREFAGRDVAFDLPLSVNGDQIRGFEIKDADGYVLYFGRPARPSDPPIPSAV